MSGGSADAAGGLRRVIGAGLVSGERLPMLEVVFDRLVGLLSTSLRALTSDSVEVAVETTASLRFGDHLDSIPDHAVAAVFRAEPWDGRGLVIVDGAMICSIVDVLLGGCRGPASTRIEGRPYTTIERTLVERLVRAVLGDLGAGFEPICAVAFKFERLESNPRLAAVARPSASAVLARLRIDMDGRGGAIALLLPHATLEPVRALLLQRSTGERFGRDGIWETHLAEELRSAEVELDAVLDERTMRLSEVMDLRPGDRLVLGCGPGAPVRLRCGAAALFEARAGRRKGRVAVRIERTLTGAAGGAA